MHTINKTKHWPFFLFALVTLSLCWMANPCDAMPKHHPMRHRFTKIRRHGCPVQRQPARADKATRCTHYDHDYLLVHRDNALVASSRASSRVKANGNLELRQCALSADCNTSDWRSVTWFVETWQFHENAPDCTKAEEVGSERPLKVLLVRFGQWRNNRTEYLCPRKRPHRTRGKQAFRMKKAKAADTCFMQECVNGETDQRRYVYRKLSWTDTGVPFVPEGRALCQDQGLSLSFPNDDNNHHQHHRHNRQHGPVDEDEAEEEEGDEEEKKRENGSRCPGCDEFLVYNVPKRQLPDGVRSQCDDPSSLRQRRRQRHKTAVTTTTEVAAATAAVVAAAPPVARRRPRRPNPHRRPISLDYHVGDNLVDT